jgi:hypothetical protein
MWRRASARHICVQGCRCCPKEQRYINWRQAGRAMKKGAIFNDAFLVCHEIYVAARELVNSRVPTTQLQSASKFLWRPDLRPRLVEYVADFARASRLILFRMYYLGGAEYEAARHLLGLSERTWSDWAEEIRQRVGAELIRVHIYPPARYFRQAATPAAAPPASTNDASEAKMAAVPCEPDFV